MCRLKQTQGKWSLLKYEGALLILFVRSLVHTLVVWGK